MIKNNKGFTLVELLSVIILIGLLLGLSVPGINLISKNINKRSLNTKIDLIEQAGILYGQDNKAMLQTNNCYISDDGNLGSCKKVSIKKLIEEDYLDSESYNELLYTNPVNNINLASDDILCSEINDDSESDVSSCCVHIYKNNNRVYAYFGKKSCEIGIDS